MLSGTEPAILPRSSLITVHCMYSIFRYFFIFTFLLSVSCSHSRATQYFIASVHRSCSLTAYPCDSYLSFSLGSCRACNGACSSMGFDADRTKRTGEFYLTTNCGTFYSQKLKLPFFPSAVANSIGQDKLTLFSRKKSAYMLSQIPLKL